MKRFPVAIPIVLFTALSFGQSTPKTILRLPDTGQTGNYTDTFGEDSDYTVNPPAFILNGNGTVTDTVTGLMWQQADGGEMTFENAAAYCDALVLGGFSDWRLPAPHEAFSILNHGLADPALNGAVFTNSNAQYWWTGAAQVNDPAKIWVTNAGGGIGNHLKTETISAGGSKRFHVRAVRDAQAPTILPARFTDNGNGTITDNLTDLIWQKIPVSDTLNWEAALNYAENLSLAGAVDWRLPNIKELQSISDETFINPSMNTNYFNTIAVGKYWSSTSLPNQTTRAWYLDTRFGITTYDPKTLRHSLICVRDGQDDTPVGVAHRDVIDDAFSAYPNPFHAHIYLPEKYRQAPVELLNALGQVVFSGTYLEKRDFSDLADGIYFLRVLEKGIPLIQLRKK